MAVQPVRTITGPTARVETYLHRAFEQFEATLENRLRGYLQQDSDATAPPLAFDPPTPNDDVPYSRFVREQHLDRESQLLLLLAFAPSLRPDFFDRILQRVMPGAGEYPQFGGIRGRQHRGFIPTGDTALFLLAGDDLDARVRWQTLLCGDHPLVKKGIVYLEDPPDGDPPMSGRLMLDADYAERFIGGRVRPPRLSLRFPAQRLETAMEWDDLVLPPRTLAEISELENWVRHGDVLLNEWNMRRKLRPGCRALFFGPPGTGKTSPRLSWGRPRAGRSTRSISRWSFPSSSARPRRTWPGCSIGPSTRTGSCSSTKPMRCSGSARRFAMRTTAMPTRKSRSCCSESRPTTA